MCSRARADIMENREWSSDGTLLFYNTLGTDFTQQAWRSTHMPLVKQVDNWLQNIMLVIGGSNDCVSAFELKLRLV